VLVIAFYEPATDDENVPDFDVAALGFGPDINPLSLAALL
jgi:hypothetical protein